MKRVGLLCFFILLLILLCNCTKGENHSNFDESVSKSIAVRRCEYVYKNKEDKTSVKIYYPQIDGLKNIDIQTKVNTLLKDGALNDYTNYWNMEGLMLEIDYDLAYMNGYYISVKFNGIGESGSYPTSLGYATNINLSTEDKISLEELLDVDGLLSVLSIGKVYLEAKNDYILEEYTFEELAERYKHLGMSELELPRYSTFYFTANRLGIYIYFPHVLGDYRSFEIDFNEINSDIRNENFFWKSVSGTGND